MESVACEQPKERRIEVLDAAKKLFFENGYRGTTIEQVAREAGYSKRTVYLDYRNKDDLFMSVCAEGGELLLKTLEEVPADELSVETSLERYLDIYVAFSREQREYFRIFFGETTQEILANCSAGVLARLANLERACLAVIVNLMERAIAEGDIPPVDPWDTAGIFTGTATGIILMSMGGSQTVFSQETLESLVNKAIWTFWAGLKGVGSGGLATGNQEG